MKALRTLWLRIHRWVALSLGWVLIFAGVSGAALLIAPSLDRWAHPELFRAISEPASDTPAVSLASVLQAARQEFGSSSNLVIRPPRAPDETMEVRVRGSWRGSLYLNPVTGAEQGRRGEREGALNILFKLHSSLWLDATGKALLAWTALAYLFLLASGLILWWPKQWARAWKIDLRKGAIRALFDLHRVGGAVFGVLIAVSVATGAYMAWRPLGAAVTWLSGTPAVKAPKLAQTAGEIAPWLPLDQLADIAQSQFGQKSPIGYIVIAGKADTPVRFRLRLPDDPHPNGMSSVWLNPHTGAVLAAQRWTALDPGARAIAVVFPLHTGEIGGLVLETALGIGGLALSGLGISGIWLWWRRRSIRRAVADHKVLVSRSARKEA